MILLYQMIPLRKVLRMPSVLHFVTRGCCFLLPAPANQPQHAEAGGEEWECGGKRSLNTNIANRAVDVCGSSPNLSR
jgi:hypothetical protein